MALYKFRIIILLLLLSCRRVTSDVDTVSGRHDERANILHSHLQYIFIMKYFLRGLPD